MRLAYLVTHPIQYQAPLLRRIASEPDLHLKVFFASDLSTRTFFDPALKQSIQWDVPLLKGYEYEVPPAVGTKGAYFLLPANELWTRLAAQGRAFRLLLVSTGYMRWHHWIAMSAASRLGMKVLVRDETSTISRLRGTIKQSVKRTFFIWLRRIVHRFLAIGSLNGSYYRQLDIPDERIVDVPYAVDNAFFQARAIEFAKQREALRVSLGLERNRPVILYAGKDDRPQTAG